MGVTHLQDQESQKRLTPDHIELGKKDADGWFPATKEMLISYQRESTGDIVPGKIIAVSPDGRKCRIWYEIGQNVAKRSISMDKLRDPTLGNGPLLLPKGMEASVEETGVIDGTINAGRASLETLARKIGE